METKNDGAIFRCGIMLVRLFVLRTTVAKISRCSGRFIVRRWENDAKRGDN